MQALFPWGQLPNITFEHLEHLEVIVVELNDLDDNVITAIAAFVGCCSSLKTFTLRYEKNASELSETEIGNGYQYLQNFIFALGIDFQLFNFVWHDIFHCSCTVSQPTKLRSGEVWGEV